MEQELIWAMGIQQGTNRKIRHSSSFGVCVLVSYLLGPSFEKANYILDVPRITHTLDKA